MFSLDKKPSLEENPSSIVDDWALTKQSPIEGFQWILQAKTLNFLGTLSSIRIWRRQETSSYYLASTFICLCQQEECRRCKRVSKGMIPQTLTKINGESEHSFKTRVCQVLWGKINALWFRILRLKVSDKNGANLIYLNVSQHYKRRTIPHTGTNVYLLLLI